MPAPPPTPPPAAPAPAPVPPPVATVLVPTRPLADPQVIPIRSSTYHALNDSEVAAAVLKGSHESPARIGLTLVDMETLLLSGMFCKECGQSGYSIVVYTR